MAFRTTGSRSLHGFTTVLLIAVCCLGARLPADAGDRAASDAYLSSVLPVITAIKHALPAPPAGWIVQDETKAGEARNAVPQGPLPVIRYHIRYKRVNGVREEQHRLDEAYAESSRRNRDAAKPRIDELIKQQTAVSIALKKATRRRNEAEQKRLNDELDENGRKMLALHEEVDRTISRDVGPYLVRDAEAEIVVAVNEEAVDFATDASTFDHRPAAFAFRSSGEQSGITRWREGGMLLLYGAWQQSGAARFRAAVNKEQPQGRAQTVRISITGDEKRAEQLLKSLDIESILSLMQAR